VGIPINGLIYEVGPDVHLAADIFNAKQMHDRYSETPEYLAMRMIVVCETPTPRSAIIAARSL
jgi:hypothetical protein